MKDDYLWNKTGDDPEIRELEEVLAVFRHEPGPAPFAAAAGPEAVKSSWLRPWLKLAFAAPVAAAMAIAVWFWGVQEREVVELSRPHSVMAPQAVRSDAPEAGTAADEPEVRESPLPSAPPRRPVRVRATAVTRPPETRRSVARTQQRTLTSEEEYAYKRLMLALSITGEKLRIVRDTIDGTTVDKEAAREERR